MQPERECLFSVFHSSNLQRAPSPSALEPKSPSPPPASLPRRRRHPNRRSESRSRGTFSGNAIVLRFGARPARRGHPIVLRASPFRPARSTEPNRNGLPHEIPAELWEPRGRREPNIPPPRSAARRPHAPHSPLHDVGVGSWSLWNSGGDLEPATGQRFASLVYFVLDPSFRFWGGGAKPNPGPPPGLYSTFLLFRTVRRGHARRVADPAGNFSRSIVSCSSVVFIRFRLLLCASPRVNLRPAPALVPVPAATPAQLRLSLTSAPAVPCVVAPARASWRLSLETPCRLSPRRGCPCCRPYAWP